MACTRAHCCLLVTVVVLLCSQLGLVHSKYAVEIAGLKVVLPQDARRTMAMAMADFGLPKYGGILK